MSASPAILTPLPLSENQAQRLGQALDGLSVNQLAWASGYAAGLAAANGPPVADAADSAADTLTVLYGSQTGNGEQLAQSLAARAREQGSDVHLASLAEYRPARLKREKLVTFIVSTHGEGDPPDDAELFHEFLLSGKAPRLDRLKFSVLALGDSSYVNFCLTGREFDRRLEDLGAERLLPIVECDIDYEEAARAWTGRVLEKLPGVIGVVSDAPRLRAVAPSAGFGRHRPFAAEVLVNQKITGAESSKDVRHIELSIEGSGLRYEPGDALAVVAANPPRLVAQLLDTLKLNADHEIELNGGRLRLDQALSTDLEITALSLGFLRAWAGLSGSSELEALLEDPAALAGLLATSQIIDVVHRFPATPGAQRFVDSLRKLGPRSYSIASGPAANPDEVHLTVAAVRYRAFGSDHWGAASTYLADRLSEGDKVDVYVEANPRFRLPPDDATDIIMIGPGTGVAPFRAFVEERAERSAPGKNWLIFGERNFSSDFLYQLEWQRHLERGRLERLDVAFSRDQSEKIYVQDRLREHGEELYRWIDRGAHVYVCGDARNMAADVDAALEALLARHAKLDRDAAAMRLKEMRRSGRYQRDVY